jgi:hypothetical protein
VSTDQVTLLARTQECVDDAFNNVENAMQLLREAGIGPETALYASLHDALGQLRYASRNIT